MARFVIVMGAAPQLKLSRMGREFDAALQPMAFDSHQAAWDYVLRHSEEPPLKGHRAEIIEDLSLRDQ